MKRPDAEEVFAARRPTEERQKHGAFYTPAPVVRRIFDVLEPLLPERLSVIDPACGAGAFLLEARRRRRRAALLGVEVEPDTAVLAQQRVPSAVIQTADALQLSAARWEPVQRSLFNDFTLWVGNPPFNGTSPLLADEAKWREALRLLPAGVSMPPGTSLREDYVFFLLLALARLEGRSGALAFITNASWLDTFQYASVRAAFVERLHLRHVERLPAGAFSGTKVETCFTVWTTAAGPGPQKPSAPAYSLAPIDPQAESLHEQWSADGEPLDVLVPVSLPGLKTRFDELLTDANAEALLSRLRALVSASPEQLATFAERFGLEMTPKLLSLHETVRGLPIEETAVRPLIRVKGLKPPAFGDVCYLDRRFIPRGDHRLRGGYDPHAVPSKLVFNVRERPLVGHFVTRPGCVTAWRHTRFAPVYVPQRVRDDGLDVTSRATDLGPLVPNLSALGQRWAQKLGGPTAMFESLARLIQSPSVQQMWAPAFASTRVLPISFEALKQV
jgi:predicted RNA methylase